jgi:hypothetical protein
MNKGMGANAEATKVSQCPPKQGDSVGTKTQRAKDYACKTASKAAFYRLRGVQPVLRVVRALLVAFKALTVMQAVMETREVSPA